MCAEKLSVSIARALLVLCLVAVCSCMNLNGRMAHSHNSSQASLSRTGQTLINLPVGYEDWPNQIEGKMPITKAVFTGPVGWAIDYGLMIVLRSDDSGRTWHIIDTSPADVMMPRGLHVVSEDCVWIWGTWTTETEWFGDPNSIVVTHDGGNTWHALPQVVHWLHRVEILSEHHAVIIGRVRPDHWPWNFGLRPEWLQRKDYENLPLVEFETRDGGKTLVRISDGEPSAGGDGMRNSGDIGPDDPGTEWQLKQRTTHRRIFVASAPKHSM